MSENSLHLETIEIVRAPGFESGGFAVDDLSAGVTIVHGPNAAGKTTMCRAIHELLWPGAVEPNCDLVGHYRLNGSSWLVETRRGNGSHQADGEPETPPSLPPADERDRYVLSLHELLDDDTRNESFADAIERETAGGYDVQAAASTLGFSSKPSTRGVKAVTTAENAIETVRTVRGKAEELKSDEQRLSTLEAELETAREARDRVQFLEQAIEHARARERLAGAQSKLAKYPEVLADVDGDEAETVASLSERIDGLQAETGQAEKTLEAARTTLGETGLPDDGLEDGVLTELKERRDRLEGLESKRDTREADLENAKGNRESALSGIPVEVDEDDLLDLEPASWKNIDQFAKEAIAIREERAQLDSLERWYDDHDSPDVDLPTLERGQHALEGWLKTPSESPETTSEPLWIGLVSAVFLTVAGVILGTAVHPALFGFVLAGIGVSVYGYLASRGSDSDGTGETWRREFEDLDIEPPSAWKQSAVRERLTDLHQQLAEHRFVERLEDHRDAQATDVDALEKREAALAEKREALIDRFGVAPDLADVELLPIVKGILRWQARHDEVVGIEAEIETLEGQLDEVRTDLEALLEPYGYENVSDAAEAAGHIRDLETRGSEHAEATRDLEGAAETIQRNDEEIDRLSAVRSDVYEGIGLDPGSFEELRSLCERAEEYQEVVTQVERAETIVDKERDKLETFPRYEGDLIDEPVPELEATLHEVQETAGVYDDLTTEIGHIEGRIAEAKEGAELEAAFTEKRRALDALEKQLESDAAKMVGDVLAEHVREETTEATRPAVFEHARELLARITAGRYRLDLDDDGDFRAIETVQRKGYALDQLSSATRLQVLLAVRVAFVERQEGGVRLPLLLDETLANTDDRKASVIIEAMAELARTGRQICYFTAQGDEVAKWRTALEEAGDVTYEIVDLAAVQDRVDGVSIPETVDVWTTPDVPEPGDHDHEAYGARLGVGPFDPREGASSAHLWYLVEDLDVLSRMLRHGVETWGQFETLVREVEPTVFGCEREQLEIVSTHGVALETYVDAWNQGRGKPVDRDVLEASGAVSSTFIEDVTALADEVDGVGTEIITALEDQSIKGFRSNKTEELETYLEREGYIEALEPLEPAEIRLRVLNTYVSAGVSSTDAAEMADLLLRRLEGPSE